MLVHLLAPEALFVDPSLPSFDDGCSLTGVSLVGRHVVDTGVVVFVVVPRHVSAEVCFCVDVVPEAVRELRIGFDGT
ncbi:MAG: hypothetical protein NTZ78_04010, partial [Candidatus Aureabacteria bacterium]|nr:hypothetical protein [Candidatus Auribacterota bacterium]